MTTKLQTVGIRNLHDIFYACKRVSTRFKKPCSPVFLDNYEKKKNKKVSAHFCKETAREKKSEKGNST